MRILVTGGAGFIGSAFVRYILDKYPNYQVNVIDNLSTGELSNFGQCHSNPNFQFFLGNISDYFITELLVENADIVVNFANSRNPLDMVSTNCEGVQILLESIAKSKTKLLHISDYSVYGGYGIHPHREDSLLSPNCPQHASQAAGDILVQGYNKNYNLASTIIRLVTPYGPFGNPKNNHVSKAIADAILEKPITIPNGSYEFMSVEDQCKAIDRIMHSKNHAPILNVGSGHRHNMTEIAHMIQKELGHKGNIIVERSTPPVQYGIDSSRAIHDIGNYPTIDIKKGIKNTVRWYKSNMSWWKDLI
jgi:dTDP-glucose 4,6-dehydratase